MSTVLPTTAVLPISTVLICPCSTHYVAVHMLLYLHMHMHMHMSHVHTCACTCICDMCLCTVAHQQS